MAVTFLQQPAAGSFQSADNPLVYVFQSNQYAQTNFSFVVEVQYAGGIIEEHLVFPERANGIAQFDASRSVKPLVKAVRRSTSFIFGEYLPTLIIRIQERYGDPETNNGLYISETCKLVKACADKQTFQPGWLESTYLPSVKWLSNAPGTTTYLKRGNAFWCSILNTATGTAIEAVYYDAAGGVIASGFSAQGLGHDRVTAYLDESLMNSHLFTNNKTLEDCYEIKVYMNQSQPYTVKLVSDDCNEPTQLSWKNNLGGLDQFLFSHNRERQLVTSTREYTKQFGNWVENPTAGNYFEHDPVNSGPTHYLKTTEPSGTIHSGWVSEVYKHWLAEVLQSVDVVAVELNALERIPVTSGKFTLDKERFSDPMNVSINYTKESFKSINT